MRSLLVFNSVMLVILLAMAALGTGMAQPPGETSKSTDPDAPKKKVSRVSPGEAEKIIRDQIFLENPRMSPDALFPLKEITTKAVADGLGMQVFQVTSGVQECESFVILDKKAHRIGQGFGGQGVNSLAVADPDGSGRKVLVFAYSWGSGIHRSHVGVFDPRARDAKEVTAKQAYFGDRGDLVVKNGKGNEIDVFVGKQNVGRLALKKKEGSLKVAIDLAKDVPADIRNDFRGLE